MKLDWGEILLEKVVVHDIDVIQITGQMSWKLDTILESLHLKLDKSQWPYWHDLFSANESGSFFKVFHDETLLDICIDC